MHERSIFMDALELGDPGEREAHLLRVCGGDDRLRSRVEALLRRHESAEGVMLDRLPDVDVSATVYIAPSLEEPGTTIGAYKLLEQIGEGGMGTVYMAEQTHPVRRKVALKVIKPGMDSRQVIARFEAERQALALMDHPNIARVLDAGATGSGRPYFVMELVRGVPITEYCDTHHLKIDDRLGLFVLVCQAVQHAHQKGIIHRDLKPTNVLVTLHDGVPVPKVIDFGIAKATGQSLTDKTLFTGLAQLIGTPLYMSPEQAEMSGLDVDTRSDIYSLGVLLYELLTGSTPFDEATFRTAALDEIRRIIREDEPPRPSLRLSTLEDERRSRVTGDRRTDSRKLNRDIRGELDWVVMKALEKDRRRRYETANDFAADIRHYLDDQPVEACPPSAGYRLRKYARRNRVALTTASIVAFALVAGTLVSVWQAVRATSAEHRASAALVQAEANYAEAHSQRARAEQQRAQAEIQRTRAEGLHAQAEERYQFARRAVDEMYTQVAQKWLDQQIDLTQLQREFLEKALAFYEQFADQRSDDPEARLEAARARFRVGNIQRGLTMRDRAETSYRKTIADLEDIEARFPDNAAYRAKCRELLASVENNLSLVLPRTEAERVLRRALDVNEKRLAADPANLSYRNSAASYLVNLANLVRNRQEKLDCQRRSIEILSKVVAEFPDSSSYRRSLVNVQTLYANALRSPGGTGDAEEILRSAVASAEKLVRDSSGSPESLATLRSQGLLARSLGWLGTTLLRAGKAGDAEEPIRRATEILEKLVEYPALAIHSEGWEFSLLSEWYLEARSAPFFDPMRALTLARRVAKQAPDNHFSWKHLALAEYLNGHWDESIQAVERWDKIGSGSYFYGTFILALAHARKGDLETARTWYDLAMKRRGGWKPENVSDPIDDILQTEAEELLGLKPSRGEGAKEPAPESTTPPG